jgi:endonuclease YncB( thermonuclease family)
MRHRYAAAEALRAVLRLALLGALVTPLVVVPSVGRATPLTGGELSRVARVVDGDTVDLVSGVRVRLVQIDTPEVYYSPECYGAQASRVTEHLLPAGTFVRLYREPKTDAVDQYGRLLRYVLRVRDQLNVNLQLVRVGAAAPYFYDYRRGRYANLLVRLALHARARHLGLWGRCPGTPWDPDHGVSTGPP